MDILPSWIVADTFNLALQAIALGSTLPVEGFPTAPQEAILLRMRLAQGTQFVLELVAGQSFNKLVSKKFRGAQSHDIDALTELMNIAGGAILGLMLPHDTEPLEMSMLKIEQFAASDWEQFIGSPEACVFKVEGNMIALRMRYAA